MFSTDIEKLIFQCSICCNNVEDRSAIYQITSCNCQFCPECMRQYCISQVNIGSVPIQCPSINCNNLLSIDEIRSFLTDFQFDFYIKLLLDYEVTKDPQRLFCPHVDCGHILTVTRDKKQPITCTKCQNSICLKCRCQWHPNEHCSQRLIVDENEIDSNIKHCPRCHFPLEWITGCAQITCINCKHIFCWYCLKSLETDFFLLHYERGSCRNRLGHSRSSIFFHRLLTGGLFLIFIILLIITSPLLLLLLPCFICCGYKRIRNYFNRFPTWEQQLIPSAV
ncbi:hypothetical protein I4U23_002467 [Adineta vaga]|nr:hypothetical protein I4U23_002467 [Adineta vaga]